ncbi:hypothetical protein ACTOJ1_000030 [Shigella flexneri]
MIFFKAVILEKQFLNGIYTYTVQGSDDSDKEYYKIFSNFVVPIEIHQDIELGETRLILILENKDSPVPLAISFDGHLYYKSKNKEEHPKVFRLIKNEVHNAIDKKKNKNKILKSYFIPFYSRLLITPYYILLAALSLFIINTIALYSNIPLSNFECLLYTLISTYAFSVVLIFFKVKHIKNSFKALQKWINIAPSRNDSRRAA